jgi:hypothetical protein
MVTRTCLNVKDRRPLPVLLYYETDGGKNMIGKLILYLVCNKIISHFVLSDILLNYTYCILPFEINLQPREDLCLAGKCTCVNKENVCIRLKTVVVLRSGEVIVCKDKDKHVTRSTVILLWERTYTILHDESHSFYLHKINRVYFFYIPADETEI